MMTILSFCRTCVLVSVFFVLIIGKSKVETKSVESDIDSEISKNSQTFDTETTIGTTVATTESMLDENESDSIDVREFSDDKPKFDDRRIESSTKLFAATDKEQNTAIETDQPDVNVDSSYGTTLSDESEKVESEDKEVTGTKTDKKVENNTNGNKTDGNNYVEETALGIKIHETLKTSKLLRENVAKALHYFLHHPETASDSKTTDALSVLYINILNRKYCSIDLLPILGRARAKSPKDQMIILMDHLVQTAPDSIKDLAKICLDVINEGKWDIMLLASKIDLTEGISGDGEEHTDRSSDFSRSCDDFLNMTFKVMNEKKMYESTVLIANLFTHTPIKGFVSEDVIVAENVVYKYLMYMGLAKYVDENHDDIHAYVMHNLGDLYNATRVDFLVSAMQVLLAHYEKDREPFTLRDVTEHTIDDRNNLSDLLKQFSKDNYTGDIMEVVFHVDAYSDLLTSVLPVNYNRYQFKSRKYMLVDVLRQLLQSKKVPGHIEPFLKVLYIYSKLSLLPKYAKDAYLNVDRMTELLEAYNNFNSFEYEQLSIVIKLMKNYFSNENSLLNWFNYRDFHYRNCVSPRKCLMKIAYRMLYSKHKIDDELTNLLNTYLSLVDEMGEPITKQFSSRRFADPSDQMSFSNPSSPFHQPNGFQPVSFYYPDTSNVGSSEYLTINDITDSYFRDSSDTDRMIEQNWLNNRKRILQAAHSPFVRTSPERNRLNKYATRGNIDQKRQRNPQFPVKVNNKILPLFLKNQMNSFSDSSVPRTAVLNENNLYIEDFFRIVCEKYQNVLLEKAVNYIQQLLA